MGWYIVIKTVKGYRYAYWQRSYRVGGKVKTEAQYIGPVSDTGRSGDRAPPQTVITTPPASCVGQMLSGPVYRSCSGYRHGRDTTAADIIKYETEDLGNAYLAEQIPTRLRSELSRRSGNDLVWVTKTKAAAERYGDEITELQLPEGSVVLACDKDDGFLVLKGKPPDT